MRLAREVLVAVRRGEELLVVHRAPAGGAYWHLVAGGVEDGETDEEAALRELEEETGLVAELLPPRESFAYPIAEEPHRASLYPPGTEEIAVTAFVVDAPPGWEPRLDHEHDDHRWCRLEEARALLRWQDSADALARLVGAVYQHPLAYLLGMQGIALLRAFTGAYGREFTHARLRELRELLGSEERFGDGVEAQPIAAREGYAMWAEHYDEPGNELIDMEQPVVREILDGLPRGVALDAACGTGRHAAYLAGLGHEVIGIDESPEMLAVARAKVPGGTFHEADLYDVPLADGSVDVVVCGLALSHVPDLERALRELVRVLRPGGHLVLSDSRGVIGDIGLPHVRIRADGTVGYMPVWTRLVSEFIAAALPLGLEVRRCEELRQEGPIVGEDESPEHEPGSPPGIWGLHPYCPAAVNAAWLGKPRALVLHFRLAADARRPDSD